MIKFYKYLYIVPYRWSLKNDGPDDFPQLSALLIVSYISFVSLADFILIISFIFNLHLFSKSIPKIITLVVGCFLLGLNYIIFIYKSKYKKINAEFELLSSSQKAVWFWGFFSYLLISLIAGAFIAILSGP